MLFPSCLPGRQAWLLGSGLPFKCCLYCSTVTDQWPETEVAMEASTPCTTHTFPNDAHWKGDFLPVWNNTPAWHIKLSWYEYSKIEPLRPGFYVQGLMRKQSCLITCIIKGVYFRICEWAKRILLQEKHIFQVVLLWAQYAVWEHNLFELQTCKNTEKRYLPVFA